ncbi:hypothetical protein V8E53_006087 [Lactarius tabidus]
MLDAGSGSEPPVGSVSCPEPQNESRKIISPWVPVSMLAVTTAALAIPLVLLRRQRASASALRKSGSSSVVTSAPPVRRAPKRGVPSHPPPPRAARAMTPASTNAAHSIEASTLSQSSSGAPERMADEDSFNGALYSLKAFSIATALVVAGGATSVWGVKTYLGVRDTQEFASAMRLTLLTKWPLLASRIHRSSDSAPLPPPIPLPAMMSSVSEPDAGPPPPVAMPEADGWTWQAAQARLSAAYEHGGVARFAETAAGELEAEAELERRKRELAVSSHIPTRS